MIATDAQAQEFLDSLKTIPELVDIPTEPLVLEKICKHLDLCIPPNTDTDTLRRIIHVQMLKQQGIGYVTEAQTQEFFESLRTTQDPPIEKSPTYDNTPEIVEWKCEENKPDEKSVRFPLGLPPEALHIEGRLTEVLGAIARFVDAGKDVRVSQMLDEFNRLVESSIALNCKSDVDVKVSMKTAIRAVCEKE